MKDFIIDSWDAIMNNQHNPLRHLDVASQHFVMQVLGWMWSMIFSLTFFSIYQFGITWMLHLVVFAGMALTVAIFKVADQAQPQLAERLELSHGNQCVWKIDTEA
jgi:hypothetical protein